jgi:hypothetical protein
MRKFLILFIALFLIGQASATYTAISAAVNLGNANDVEAFPTAWTTLAGNGSINYYAWPAQSDLYLLVNVTGILTTNYLSVMAGDNPPAFRASLGNLTTSGWTDAAYETRIIGPLESARFKNSTGYLEISSYNLTGKVAVIKAME